MDIRKLMLASAAASSLVLAAPTARATIIYDANAEMVANEAGTPTNPFGTAAEFTAGESAGLGGTFSALPNHQTNFAGNAGLDGYDPSTDSVPVVLVNTNGGPLSTNFGVTLEPSEILMHPQVPVAGTALYSDLLFTAPVAGSYTIAGIFEKLNPQGNGEDVHVLVNNVSIYDQILLGANTESNTTGAFNLPGINLAIGDKVSFVVGPNGSNAGDDGSDSVGFQGTLTVAPEPASLGLLGLGGLSLLARRRRA